MPELPEVEITMRGIAGLVGQTVQSVTIRHPQLRWPIPADLPAVLPQLTLRSLERRAKYILANFDTGTLILHLGMSGRICLLPQFETAQKHDHFDIQFNHGPVLRLRDPRRFGAVLWATQAAQHPLIKPLGPEPLDDTFNGDYLYNNIRTRSAAIKTTIMDSHLVVGVGNIYASESLFRAKINPNTPANKLNKARCARLAQEIKGTLGDAILAGGSSLRDFFGADGNPGYFQQAYFVYGRTGQACKICHTPIKQIKQSQRSTFYCPVCQK